MKKQLCLLLIVCLLMPWAVASASSDAMLLTPGDGELVYCFDALDASFVLMEYKTPTESGQLVLRQSDGQGHYEGSLPLAYSERGGKVTVKISTLNEKQLMKGTAQLPSRAEPLPEGASRAKVSQLELEGRADGFHYRFDAPGAGRLLLIFDSLTQSGRTYIAPVDGEGHYEGDIALPWTYALGNVNVQVVTASGKTQLAKASCRKAYVSPVPCEQAAKGRLTGVTVCIDPGHQAKGSGKNVKEPLGPGLSKSAVMQGGMAEGCRTYRLEHIVVLEIAEKLRAELLRQGATVVMTRSAPDEFISNMNRAETANAHQADILLRLHCDLSGKASKRGISIHSPVRSDYARAVADADTYKAMGTLLLDAMRDAVGYEKKPATGHVTLTDKFVGNNWAKMPCFLVEMGYMSNPAEDRLLSSPDYQQLLAEGMAQGVYDIMVMRGTVRP